MANLTDIRSSWSTGASEGGVTVYATKENLPTTGLTSGDQAYVTNTSRLYISNGSGWYNVALINATPALTISPTGSIELSKVGATTTITLTGTDSDNAVAGLTFSVDSDGSFGGLGTISQDSSVFTITPLSEDSATTTSSTLTFKASDGISFGSGTSILSLTFKVANSKFTQLLLQADTAGTDNQVDASSNAQTITEVGNVTSTSWTPYHPGGYSNYMTASGNGYVEWASPPTFSATAWCVETWFKPDGMPSVAVGTTGHWSIFGCWTANTNAKEFLILGGSSGELRFYYSFNGSSASYIDSTSGKFSANTWVHLALSFDGTNYTLYADGVNVARVTDSTQIANTNAPLSFGKSVDGAGATQTYVNGWYADGRVINGSTLESSNTFPVPTNRIDTSVANTQAVFHNKPHVRQSLTYGGDATIKRDGPYDYIAYSKAEHGGSVYFDGTGDYLGIPDDNGFELDGDFAIECWFYRNSVVSGTYCSVIGGNGNGSNGWNIYITNSNGAISFFHSSFLLTYTEGVKNGVWYHVAVTRSGTDLKLFVNGQERASATNSSTFNQNDANAGTRIGYDINANGYFNGYVTDARVVKGSSVYTTNFLAPTAPLTAITNTKLLTCTNKNDIWDASSGSQVMTKSGNVTANNTQRKFATSSAVYFDGSGDYIDFVKKDDYSFESGVDFTVEGWWYMNSVASRPPFIAMGTGVDASPAHYSDWNLYYNSSNNLNWYAYSNGGNVLRQFAWTPVINTWYHIAVTRHGTNMRAFINGTQIGTTLTDSTAWTGYSGSRPLRIGRWQYGGGTNGYLNGYAQDIRITKGLARYNANFTPPTQEFSG